MESIIILGGLLSLFIFRVPVAFALGGLGMFLLWWMGFNLNGVPQRLYTAQWILLNCWLFHCFY